MLAADRVRRTAAPFALAALLGTTFVTVRAAAQPSEADLRAARELFTQAEHDEDAGHWADAYDKMSRVGAVKMTAGVRYHLALCQEKMGKLAMALDLFHEAQKQAQGDEARDVLRLVGKQLEELEPRVPRLTVHVVPPVEDAVVNLDGTPLAKALVGVAVPLDPGTHTVEASAPNRAPARATITMGERDVTSIDLQLGEPRAPGATAPATGAGPAAATATGSAAGSAPATAAGPASAPAPESAPSSHSSVGPLLATAGAIAFAGLGVGAYLAAGDAFTSGQQQCAASQTRGPCDSAVSTVRAWDFTAAGAWLGAAALGTVAVVLWAHSSHSQAASAALVVGPARIELGGRF